MTLFERFDSPRPLGSGIILQPTGLAVMKALGCFEDMFERGHLIHTMTGRSMPNNKVVLNVEYNALGDGMFGLAVHRAALFEVLFAKVEELGIEIHTGTEIHNVSHGPSDIGLHDAQHHTTGHFDLCVDASGANSLLHPHALTPPVRRPLKYGAIWGALDWPDKVFEPHVLSQRYVAAHTMIGVLPMGRHSEVDRDQVAFFWSLPSADYATWRRNGLDDWKRTVRGIWPDTEVLLDQIQDPEQMTLARYAHHTLAKPFGPRLAFIGDAAHATSPQLGQGANMGLLDAWSLSHALKHTSNVEQALHEYARLRRWHVRIFQLASLNLTPFYQSDSRALAGLRDLMFDPLSKLPLVKRVVAGLVTGLLANPLGKVGLSHIDLNTVNSNRVDIPTD